MLPTQSQGTPEEDDNMIATKKHLIRKKRQLFETKEWKPWSFRTDELFDFAMGKIVGIL